MKYHNKFKALSDPIRLDILDALNDKEMSAGELVDKFSLPNSKVSYHLSILKNVGIVKERKYKNYIFYSLNLDGIDETLAWFDRFKK